MLGEHAGVHQFTVGQRKGLGIASASRCTSSQRSLRPRLSSSAATMTCCASCVAKDVNWISIERLAGPIRAQVKIRNKHVAAGRDASCPRRDHSGGSSLRRAATRRHARPRRQCSIRATVVGGGWIE